MSNQKISQYKSVLLKFLEEIECQFPEEGELGLIKFCLQKLPASIPFNMFNTLIHKNNSKIKRMITERDHEFFFQSSPLGFYCKNKMKYFYEVWKSDKLDEETKCTIWDWMDVLVDIIDKYNYEKKYS